MAAGRRGGERAGPRRDRPRARARRPAVLGLGSRVGDLAAERARLGARRSRCRAETLAALELARRASELTRRRLRRDRAPLVEAWGFGPATEPSARPPGRDDSPALRARVGYRLLALDAARSTVAKARPDVACDVSALAGRLGGRPDRPARSWRSATPTCWWTSAARWRRGAGAPTARRWRVAVEGRRRGKVRARSSSWRTPAVATSGDYRKVWTDAQGRRRSHILDPRTGEPVAHDARVGHRRRRATGPGRTRSRRAPGARARGGPRAGRARAARRALRPAAARRAASPSGRRRPSSRSWLPAR